MCYGIGRQTFHLFKNNLQKSFFKEKRMLNGFYLYLCAVKG